MGRPALSKGTNRRRGRPLYTSEQAATRKPGAGWKEIFLDELRKMPIVVNACRKAKVARRTAYYNRDHDEDFGAAWDDAIEEGYEVLREVMMKAALSGDMKTALELVKMFNNGSRKDDGKTNITLQWGKK